MKGKGVYVGRAYDPGDTPVCLLGGGSACGVNVNQAAEGGGVCSFLEQGREGQGLSLGGLSRVCDKGVCAQGTRQVVFVHACTQ